MTMENKDYYKILGVSEDASDSEIKSAYRKLAKLYHPDSSKKSNAADIFVSINEAYEVLKDPKKRDVYDRYGKEGLEGDVTPGFDKEIFDSFFETIKSGGFSNLDFDDKNHSKNKKKKKEKDKKKKSEKKLWKWSKNKNQDNIVEDKNVNSSNDINEQNQEYDYNFDSGLDDSYNDDYGFEAGLDSDSNDTTGLDSDLNDTIYDDSYSFDSDLKDNTFDDNYAFDSGLDSKTDNVNYDDSYEFNEGLDSNYDNYSTTHEYWENFVGNPDYGYTDENNEWQWYGYFDDDNNWHLYDESEEEKIILKDEPKIAEIQKPVKSDEEIKKVSTSDLNDKVIKEEKEVIIPNNETKIIDSATFIKFDEKVEKQPIDQPVESIKNSVEDEIINEQKKVDVLKDEPTISKIQKPVKSDEEIKKVSTSDLNDKVIKEEKEVIIPNNETKIIDSATFIKFDEKVEKQPIDQPVESIKNSVEDKIINEQKKVDVLKDEPKILEIQKPVKSDEEIKKVSTSDLNDKVIKEEKEVIIPNNETKIIDSTTFIKFDEKAEKQPIDQPVESIKNSVEDEIINEQKKVDVLKDEPKILEIQKPVKSDEEIKKIFVNESIPLENKYDKEKIVNDENNSLIDHESLGKYDMENNDNHKNIENKKKTILYQISKRNELDIEYHNQLDQILFLNGAVQRITYFRQIPCILCNSTGADLSIKDSLIICFDCNGQKIVPECSTCNGFGKLIAIPCKQCFGKTYCKEQIILDIRLPIITDTDYEICYPGFGHIFDNDKKGDLKIIYKIIQSKFFKIVDNDILTIAMVDPIVAAFGGYIEIPTVNKIVRVKIKGNFMNNDVIVVRKHGLPSRFDSKSNKNYEQGDLIVKVKYANLSKNSKATNIDDLISSENLYVKNYINSVLNELKCLYRDDENVQNDETFRKHLMNNSNLLHEEDYVIIKNDDSINDDIIEKELLEEQSKNYKYIDKINVNKHNNVSISKKTKHNNVNSKSNKKNKNNEKLKDTKTKKINFKK